MEDYWHCLPFLLLLLAAGRWAEGLEEAPIEEPGCTRLGRHCLKEGYCNNSTKRCHCPASKPVGDATMECAASHKVICSVDSDPKVHTYRGAMAPLNLPCWYRVTDFQAAVRPPPSKKDFRFCKVRVRALNRITKDNLFFVGLTTVEFWFASNHEQKATVQYESYIKFEVTHTAAWKFQMEGQEGKNPWTMWRRNPQFWNKVVNETFPDGFPIEMKFDADYFAVLHFPLCDIKIKYRAFGPQQPQIFRPGVTVSVPVQGTHFPKPYHKAICLTLQTDNNTFKVDASQYKLKNSGQMALFYLILQEDVRSSTEKNLYYHDECSKVRKHLRDNLCQDSKYLAIQLCGPILNMRRRFLSCVGKNQVMTVFSHCVAWACFGDSDSEGTLGCAAFHSQLEKNGCQKTALMKDIHCNDERRKYYRDHVFNP